MSLPYMEFYVTDFDADTKHLTRGQVGVYIRMLMVAWITPGCSMPNDLEWIADHIVARKDVDEEVIADMKVVIEQFWKVSRGRLYQKKQREISVKSKAKHDARKKAGKKGGKAKARKTNDKSPSKAGSKTEAKPYQPEPEPEPEPKVKKDVVVTGAKFENLKPILDACISAAKPALKQTQIPMMDFSTLKIWLNDPKAPCDLEADILPTLERLAKTARPNSVGSWKYFQNAVIEARDNRLAGLPEPQKGSKNGKRTDNAVKSQTNRAQAATADRRDALAEALRRRQTSGVPKDA